MTKAELIRKVADEADIPVAAADQLVDTIFASMEQTLVDGGRIEIRGFGSFRLRQYVGHIGRNPKTGVETVVKPKRNPFFKVGKDLKATIQAGSI